MQNQNSIIQKLRVQKQSTTDQDRDINGRFISSKSKNLWESDPNKDESQLNPKESYNGGSTYGEHH